MIKVIGIDDFFARQDGKGSSEDHSERMRPMEGATGAGQGRGRGRGRAGGKGAGQGMAQREGVRGASQGSRSGEPVKGGSQGRRSREQVRGPSQEWGSREEGGVFHVEQMGACIFNPSFTLLGCTKRTAESYPTKRPPPPPSPP